MPGAGAILVSETEVGAWRAILEDGRVVRATSTAGLVSIDVPADAGTVTIQHAAQARRTAALVAQLVALLLVFSIVLRPPSAALQEEAT